MKRLKATAATFIYGGLVYCLIELIYRGRTDFSMFILAGCCSIIMAGVNNLFSYNMQYWLQVLIASLSCIGGEYITGIIANRQFNIWDYRGLPLTFAGGQLNLFFCLVWVCMSIIGIPLLDYVEWKYMKDNVKPYYMIGKKKIYLY